mgnify:CR=1 FL=1
MASKKQYPLYLNATSRKILKSKMLNSGLSRSDYIRGELGFPPLAGKIPDVIFYTMTEKEHEKLLQDFEDFKAMVGNSHLKLSDYIKLKCL